MPFTRHTRPCGCVYRLCRGSVKIQKRCRMHRELIAEAAHKKLMKETEAVLAKRYPGVDCPGEAHLEGL